MSVPEKVISLSQSAPATLQHSQQSTTHNALDAEPKDDKLDIVPQGSGQRSGQRSELSAAARWAQIVLEDMSKDGASDPRFERAVAKSKIGGVPPGTETCTSSLLVFEDISMDGSDSVTEVQAGRSSNSENSFLPLPANELCAESSKRGIEFNPTGGTGLSKVGRSGSQIESSVSVVLDPDTQSVGFPSRKRSHPISSDDTLMEHSGIEEKRSRLCVKDGVMKCLRLQGLDEGDSNPPQRIAMELARCLHEPKFQLLMNVVRVLGAEKALKLFEETAQIQEEGGKLTADGNKKKSPGGVFLTLVKTSTTPEQKKEIFQVDKQIVARRVKQEKKRKANEWRRRERQRELAVVKQKAEWELRIFRAQLGDDFEDEQTLKAGLKCPRKDLNMHKRLPASALLNKEGVSSSSCTGEEGLVHSKENGIRTSSLTAKSKTSDKGEVMEVETSGVQDFDSRECSHRQQLHRLKAVDRSTGNDKTQKELSSDRRVALAEERLAAEEFERMNECDLDFGIDLA